MKTFKTIPQRLHAICIRAQSGKPHGLSLHRFGLICAMRGYRLIGGDSGFIEIKPAAGPAA